MDLAQAGFCGFDLVIMHLTDHLLSKEEVNGLFQVITEMFFDSGCWWEAASAR